MKTKTSTIYPGIPLLSGRDAESKARATLQKLWLAHMEQDYESTNGNPSRLLYDWLVKRGADDQAMRRCGFRLLDEDENLKGSDRIGGLGDFGNQWFDHARILRRKKDGCLFVMVEPYSINNAGLLQIAEMACLGLSVWLTGDSGWNPGWTLQILVSEKE